MSFTRTLKRGNRGKDVEAAKRGVYRFLGTGELTSLSKQPEFVRQFYGPFFVQHVKKAQKKLGLPQTGVFGPATQKKIMPYLDDYAKSLLRPKAAPKPKLVAPNQGYGSLTSRLWEAYSLGRNMGMSDLGTYNPASRLPSGRRSDHAYLPAKAFDLGISPDTGYQNPVARKFFHEMIGRPEVEYVILGNKIWSRAGGLRNYSHGGHENHVHVSGR
jgi:hypothetical protein